MTRALILIDLQLDYFPGGAFPLVEPDAAVAVARSVLDAARAAGDPVIHVFHVATDPGATFFRPDTAGVAIHPLVEPLATETVIEKHEPNSFRGTTLQAALADVGADEVVVVGMMSSMCVDSTVRAASELGITVTVVEDGCAAPDLTLGGTTIPGGTVHASFMAALDGSFATVVSSSDFR